MKKPKKPEVVLSDSDFDNFVSAFIDCAKFNSEGKLEITLSVNDTEELKRRLNIPKDDEISLTLILKSLSHRIADTCAGGRCAGTVIQKLPN